MSSVETARTHCPANHPYDGPNTYVDRLGKRYCRACGCKWGHTYDDSNTHVRPDGTRQCRQCHAEVERRRRRSVA